MLKLLSMVSVSFARPVHDCRLLIAYVPPLVDVGVDSSVRNFFPKNLLIRINISHSISKFL